MEEECKEGAARKESEERQLEESRKAVDDLQSDKEESNRIVEKCQERLADATREITKRRQIFDEEQKHDQSLSDMSKNLGSQDAAQSRAANQKSIDEAQTRLDADLPGLEAEKEGAEASLRDAEADNQRLAAKLENQRAVFDQLNAVSAAE